MGLGNNREASVVEVELVRDCEGQAVMLESTWGPDHSAPEGRCLFL